jgi:molybdopterin biosynthesis enzyme
VNSNNISSLSLTSLEAAHRFLTVAPVAPTVMPLERALRRVAAAMPPLTQSYPAHDIATRDGWAVPSGSIVGASSYSPAVLAVPPIWVETGEHMPAGCDCVLDPGMVEQAGSLVQVIAEAAPGFGIRRAGDDIAPGAAVLTEGRQLSALDLLVARAAGLTDVPVRYPRVRIVDVAPARGPSASATFIAEASRAAGADVACIAANRDAASIAKAIGADDCDLVLTVGGTGVGRSDSTAAALASRGALLVHGLALQPGRTTAIGRLGACPVIALPGAWHQALGAWWTLAEPTLDRLSLRRPLRATTLPLARKIASAPGMADIVLLKEENGAWMPLAIGDLSLDHVSRADAWLVVRGDSEGYAAGTPCAAVSIRGVRE